MTNKEILEKVIYKAEGNGCTRCLSSFLDYHDEDDITIYNKHYQIIFSHDFAKAFFGEKGYGVSSTDGNHLNNWQYHLREMVLEEKPLKYLEKFLKD